MNHVLRLWHALPSASAQRTDGRWSVLLLVLAAALFGAPDVRAQVVQLEAPSTNDGAVRSIFTIDTDGGLVAKGELGVGTIPATGPGLRMMWYPYRGAFRAGSTDDGGAGAYWDDANIGFYSWAGGNLTTARGFASFAFGDDVTVTSVGGAAFGSGNTVTGTVGFSAGASNWCSGFSCVTLGYNATATGQGSVAIGYRSTADANYSTALGHRASTNGRTGAFVISDASTTDSTEASANNQFRARFAGGYQFYTNSSQTVGVSLASSSNSWASISDSTKKERFLPVDGERVLAGVAGLRLGTWNYKGQREPQHRHYGPVAQEFYSAFGRDALGTIGTDTTLATADVDGVLFVAAQALEERTRLLAEENAALAERLAQVEAENAGLRAAVGRIETLEAALARLTAAESARAADDHPVYAGADSQPPAERRAP